jgi:hypothetical protein
MYLDDSLYLGRSYPSFLDTFDHQGCFSLSSFAG